MPEEPENTPEITLESVVETPVDELNDDQKTFIKDNVDDLSDEQKETFKPILEEKPVKPEEIEVETRGGKPPEEKKPKEKPEEEEEIAPEDEKTIGKVLDKRMKPVTEALQGLQKVKDEQEVDSFLRVKPEYSQYREAMIKYVSHPAYANVPIHNIAAIVAAPDLQKLGAQKEREAIKKAEETKGGGATQRKQLGGKVDWATAPKAEFEAQKAKVLGQG